MDKNGISLDIRAEKIKQLAQLFPEFVNSEGDIDITLLKYLLEKPETALKSIEDNEKPTPYQLTWKGREKAFLKTLETTTKTLNPDRSNSIDFDSTENLLIEGENLQVLQTLQNAYQGKVKMIYIDPPYNTGNDYFVYPDNFKENKRNYQKEAGIRNEDEEIAIDSLFKKNSKDSGNYHSNWLSMMYPRLFLARNLLREDGVIFVSIDDNEQANLKLLMNQIFGEENFISQMVWRRSDNQANVGTFAKVKEYIFLYCKNIQFVKIYKMSLTERAIKEYRYEDGKGKFRRDILFHKTRGRHEYEVTTPTGKKIWGSWMIKEEEMLRKIANNEIYWTKGGDEQPYGKIYLSESEGQIPNDFLGIEFGTNQEGSLEVEDLLKKRYFDFPKPFSLIKHFITIGCEPNEDHVILDFFSGSGTTAHAVLEQNLEDGGNRKFICVQLAAKVELNSEAIKDGYNTIFDITKARIRKVIEKIKQENETKLFGTSQDLGFRTFKLANSNFRQWNGEVNNDKEVLQLEIDHNKISNIPDSPIEFMLYEILLKEGHLLTEKIEVKQAGEGNFYYLPSVNVCIILEAWGLDMRSRVVDLHPKKVIILDSLFANDDQFMSNTAIYLESFGIDLEIV